MASLYGFQLIRPGYSSPQVGLKSIPILIGPFASPELALITCWTQTSPITAVLMAALASFPEGRKPFYTGKKVVGYSPSCLAISQQPSNRLPI